MLTIIGLGMGEDALSPAAETAIINSEYSYVQTASYGVCTRAMGASPAGEYLDSYYEQAQNFDDLNRQLVAAVLERATGQDICFCVLGDGIGDNAVAAELWKRTVEEGIAGEILPGRSIPNTALNLCGVSGLEGYRVQEMPSGPLETGQPLVLPQIGERMRASETKIWLMEYYPDDHVIYVVDPVLEEAPCRVPLWELDRLPAYTSFTTAVLPALSFEKKQRYTMADFLHICRVLRSPEGCPWDREQTHESLKPNLLEEAYEVLGAIDEVDPDHLCEELGDVLLQLALHATIAEEHGEFGFLDVSTGIGQKMVRRHPHVFGDITVADTAEVLDNWEEIKRQERGQESIASVMKDAGKGLPPLKMAEELQKKARGFGFDWKDPHPAMEKIKEELGELHKAYATGEGDVALEAGDLLFACVNAIRLMGLDPDTSLLAANEKFKRRTIAMEDLALLEGKRLAELDLDAQDLLWERVKKGE
ncbi:nucleoside triphosphate pyrophosphohydrolase [Eubacteriales bacterium OttesenSCG-928-M02]|nr:nucleoside triphosphate pyrophosphohydrolase [Eubacteriales bacterium OttesenSCG-928-M02]